MKNISILTLPKDNELKNKWIKRIHNDLSHIKNPHICIKHFEEKYIILHDEAINDKGQLLKVERLKPKLASDAIPTIFLNCPKYLSVNPLLPTCSKRLSNDEKFLQSIKQAKIESLQIKNTYDEIHKITNLVSLTQAFKNDITLQPMAQVIIYHNKICIAYISIDEEMPILKSSIVIDETLHFNLYIENRKYLSQNLPLKSDYITSTFDVEQLDCFIKNNLEMNKHPKNKENRY